MLHLRNKERIEAEKVLLAAGWSTSWLSPQTERLVIKHQMSQADVDFGGQSFGCLPVFIFIFKEGFQSFFFFFYYFFFIFFDPWCLDILWHFWSFLLHDVYMH